MNLTNNRISKKQQKQKFRQSEQNTLSPQYSRSKYYLKSSAEFQLLNSFLFKSKGKFQKYRMLVKMFILSLIFVHKMFKKL